MSNQLTSYYDVTRTDSRPPQLIMVARAVYSTTLRPLSVTSALRIYSITWHPPLGDYRGAWNSPPENLFRYESASGDFQGREFIRTHRLETAKELMIRI